MSGIVGVPLEHEAERYCRRRRRQPSPRADPPLDSRHADRLAPTRPQPGDGAGAGHRVGGAGGVPLGRSGRQERRRRRRCRGDALGAVDGDDGRHRRHRRGREGQRPDAVQRRERRRRHATARRRRRRSDRRDHADGAGPHERPVGHRRQRPRVDVRPGPVVLHGEDRRRSRSRRLDRHHGHADAEPALDRQGDARVGGRPDGRDPRPPPPRRPDRRGAGRRRPDPADQRRRRLRRDRGRLSRAPASTC